MSNYEKQIQATAKYYVPRTRKIKQNAGKILSSVAPQSDRHMHEWADVLKDLDAYY